MNDRMENVPKAVLKDSMDSIVGINVKVARMPHVHKKMERVYMDVWKEWMDKVVIKVSSIEICVWKKLCFMKLDCECLKGMNWGY